MRYHLLAVDFDGTLADGGHVDGSTVEYLRKIKHSGRRLVMVTGRRLEPLIALCPWLRIFDRVVAENGALVYDPESRDETLLAQPPSADLVRRMKDAGVDRVHSGRVIVATWQPHEAVALRLIRELGLDLQIIFNKDAVMLLPSGCNKATGLRAALDDLQIAPLNVVAIGDAENDEAMLRMAGVSVAVDNALAPVKSMCDIVTRSARGAGVNEACEMILEDDLAWLRSRPDRGVPLGDRLDGEALLIPPYGASLLVTGGPAGGKSRFAMSFFQSLRAQGAQCCIIDPEGDYTGIEDSVTIGTVDRPPAIEEVLGLLQAPSGHAIVSFLAVAKRERPDYFNKLFRALSELRSRMGRPHWIIVDEAHYMAPSGWAPAEEWNPDELKSIMFVTAYQEQISDVVLSTADWIVTIAEDPKRSLMDCCERMSMHMPVVCPPADLDLHHALAWRRGDARAVWFSRREPDSAGKRHRQSLLLGEMDEGLQFVFTGPKGELSLRAKNLRAFVHLAEGLDDATWLFHLRRNDYSVWFGEVVKDSALANAAAAIENDESATATASRDAIIGKIRERFE